MGAVPSPCWPGPWWALMGGAWVLGWSSWVASLVTWGGGGEEDGRDGEERRSAERRKSKPVLKIREVAEPGEMGYGSALARERGVALPHLSLRLGKRERR